VKLENSLLRRCYFVRFSTCI